MKTSIHRIAIPSILEVGKGNISNVGNLIKKALFKNVLICFGEGIEELFGNSICNSLKEANIEIAKIETITDISFEEISAKAFEISNDVEALIGVGGGKAIDAVKYMSFLKKLPFISIPTSTSNDGFSSAGASLLVKGKRMSLPAKTPYGIIIDIDVIKGAPEKFIFSGIGDLVSNITALYDWKFEEDNGKTIIDDFATMISKKAVNSFVRTEFKTIKEDLFLKELVDSLTLNGISMEIAGNSSPASGSEGPKPNFIGIGHLGQNLFANCVVALDARTGKRLWHFQEIRHDIWDLDIPAPPSLGTITREGRKIDVVTAVTKIGNTLMLDRVSGKPIFPSGSGGRQ